MKRASCKIIENSFLLLLFILVNTGCTSILQRSASQPPIVAPHISAFAQKEGAIVFRGSYVNEPENNDFRIIDGVGVDTAPLDTTFLYVPDQHVHFGFTRYNKRGSLSLDLVVGMGTEQAFPGDSRLREPQFNVRTSGLLLGFTRYWRRDDPTFRMASSISTGSYQFQELRYVQDRSYACSRNPECQEFSIEETVLSQLNVNLNQAFTLKASERILIGGNLFTNYLLGQYGTGFLVGTSAGLTIKPHEVMSIDLYLQLPNMGNFTLMEHDDLPFYSSNPRVGITVSFVAF